MTQLVECPHCDSVVIVSGVRGKVTQIGSTIPLSSDHSAECSVCESEFWVDTEPVVTGDVWFSMDSEFVVMPHQNKPIPLFCNQKFEICYDIIVRKGKPVELLFMDDSEFKCMEKGQRYRVYADICKQNTVAAEDSITFSSGEYAMIIRTEEGAKKGSLIDLYLEAEAV